MTGNTGDNGMTGPKTVKGDTHIALPAEDKGTIGMTGPQG